MDIKIDTGVINISLSNPIQLTLFECLLNKDCDNLVKTLNNKFGVYFIIDNKKKKIFSTKGEFVPSNSIKYIGKARSETIFARSRKHLRAISSPEHGSDIRPGRRFREFAASINHAPSKLWVIPAFICIQKPFQISCAEEYFLCKYEKKYKQLPQANTEGSCLKMQYLKETKQ